MDYPWFEYVKDNIVLNQGDLIFDCPILIPPSELKEGESIELEVSMIDSIILSQSCDLVNKKIDNVLVCPFYSLKSFIDELSEEDRNSKRAKKRIIENMKSGNLPGYHLLNKSEEIESLEDYQVVDFRNVYSVNYTNLEQMVAKEEVRIKLLPPYREQLSQAFARFFMRVGLPQDFKIEGYY